jgi:signal transduction histidine kinase
MLHALLSVVDRFLPAALEDVDSTRRMRSAIVQSFVGVFFTLIFAGLYTGMGSAWSGASLLPISAWLGITPLLLRRGVSLLWIGHCAFALAWASFGVVAYRTGGFSSPALVWTFLLPLTCHAACGRAAAIFWTGMSAWLLAGFYALELCGLQTPHDLPAATLSALRVVGYLGVVATTIIVLLVMDGARQQAVDALRRAERALERQRILSAMHDGAGSQLLWLLLQARRGALEHVALLAGLESCLADLRLMADAVDGARLPCSQVLGSLRARVSSVCESAQVTLDWETALDPDVALDSQRALQVSRTVQEAVTNALRHASTQRLRVCVTRERSDNVLVSVRDFGIGFDAAAAASGGRGLRNMRERARQLGGELRVRPETPGTSIELRFPEAPPHPGRSSPETPQPGPIGSRIRSSESRATTRQ